MPVKPRTHLELDTVILVLFVVVMISGLVLWFVLPGGGYQGGRNPAGSGGDWLGLARTEWRDVHNWAGLVMGILATLHLVLHLPWIVCQVERLLGLTRSRRRVPARVRTGDVCQ